jgi:hypothetical protein
VSFLDLQGYLRKLALRVTWPSFGNTTVFANVSFRGVFKSCLLPSIFCRHDILAALVVVEL